MPEFSGGLSKEQYDPFAELANPTVRERMGNEMLSFIADVRKTHPDTLVFLDRSARPAAWLFRSCWQLAHPDEEMPEVKFINIGTEKISDVNFTGELASRSEQKEYIEQIKANTEKVEKLRRIFTKGAINEAGKKELTNETYMDGKRIWLVDEFSAEGGTLMTAKALFQEAFAGRHRYSIQDKVLFSKEPPWVTFDSDLQTHKESLIGVYEDDPDDLLVKPFLPISQEQKMLRQELRAIAQESVTRLNMQHTS